MAGWGGVGKTELAVQAAHTGLARGWFPGGVLAINLHGYESDQRLDAATALDRLLRRLGVPGDHIPTEVEERAELYRAVLHAYRAEGRAVLVVLDNASPDTPVAELLPGVGSVIVTSRHTLPRLGGRLLDLDALQPAKGMEMLARLLELKVGRPDPRLIAQEVDAERMVALCGGLPLAIEVVAALLAAHPRKPLAATVARLEADRTVLGEVDAVLRLSYECLAPVQQRVLRMMTVNPGPQVSTPAIAALTGLPEEQVLAAVEALAEAHLIAEGEPYGWWRMHDLVHQYATGLAHTTTDQYDDALERLLEYYHDTARDAGDRLRPQVPGPGRIFADREQALAWLDIELPNLTAAAHTAATHRPGRTRGITIALGPFLDWRRLFHDRLELNTLALDTACRTGDRPGQAAALEGLGLSLREVRRFQEAITAHTEAATIFRETGDRHGECKALNNLGLALRRVRRFQEAITAHSDAATIYREIGDRHGEGRALNNLGLALREVRRFQEAITAHTEAATSFREIGDRHGEGRALNNLGLALRDAGRHSEAVSVMTQAVESYRETGDDYRYEEARKVLESIERTRADQDRS